MAAGVMELNKRLQLALNPNPTDHIKRFDDTIWGVGDRIMQLANNYDYPLFNGDQGQITGGHANLLGQLARGFAALHLDLQDQWDKVLIVTMTEFGRTSMRENRNGVEMKFLGRDHNPGAFTLWMAGGGVKGGVSYGETDDFGYQSVIDKVSVHDLHATILHLLGFDHLKFTYPVSGVNMRLTNVTKPGSEIVQGVLA